MDYNQIKEALSQIPGCQVQANARLAEYTSFKIGGPADLLVEPTDPASLQQILQTLSEAQVPFFLLGKGSNLLVGDLGIRGVVIRMTALDYVRVEENRIIAGSGITLAKLANAALKANLAGLEFASGIPGTLGGAVVMNAGAYGGEMKDVISKVTAYTPKGEKKVLTNGESAFSYRHSGFQQNGWIVAEVELELTADEPDQIRERMNDLNQRRKDKQPLEYPSAGSAFKRPPGYYAGALIDEAGLRGFQIGGAQVSEKHAGFIINTGDATAKDVVRLIRHIQAAIKEREGVDMEPEVRMVGEFEPMED